MHPWRWLLFPGSEPEKKLHKPFIDETLRIILEPLGIFFLNPCLNFVFISIGTAPPWPVPAVSSPRFAIPRFRPIIDYPLPLAQRPPPTLPTTKWAEHSMHISVLNVRPPSPRGSSRFGWTKHSMLIWGRSACGGLCVCVIFGRFRGPSH